MTQTAYFTQECPTCGRSLHIRVEYLGRNVVCQHCRGKLIAWQGEGAPQPASAEASGTKLLERVEELLELANATRRAAV